MVREGCEQLIGREMCESGGVDEISVLGVGERKSAKTKVNN